MRGSIAEQAGMLVGDLIVTVAGLPSREPEDVIAAVGRQAPGTWLPIVVRRGEGTLDLVARFPPRQ
jgi:S1-C subfamily serine protease